MPRCKRGVRGLRLARMPEAEREQCVGRGAGRLRRVAGATGAARCRDRAGRAALRASATSPRTTWPHHGGRELRAAATNSSTTSRRRSTRTCARASRPAATSRRATTSTRCATREAMKQQFAAALDGIDALLTPTTHDHRGAASKRWTRRTTPAHFTRFGNFLDLCALALPNGSDARRAADLIADRLPRLRRGDGAAHRLGLPEGDGVAPAAAAALIAPAPGSGTETSTRGRRHTR